MKKLDRAINRSLSLLLWVGAFLFWAIPYRSALSYQEQYQLFLTTGSYFSMMMSRPAGLAAYAAEWLVQFYNNYWIGAAILATLLTGLQLLTWRVARNLSGQMLPPLAYALTVVPVLALWLTLGDTNVLPAFAVAVLMALAAALPFTYGTVCARWWIAAIVAVPVFYWLAGPSVMLLVALMCARCWRSAGSRAARALGCVALVVYAAIVFAVSFAVVPYPWLRQIAGIGYYRIPTQLPLLEWVVMLLFALFAILAAASCLRHWQALSSWRGSVAVVALSLTGAWGSFGWFYNPRVYELMDYDMLLRTNSWQAIIDKAEKRHPDLPISVSATNLALAMKGQLDQRAFEFNQYGGAGLIPAFQKEPNSSVVTSEIYYQLGLINTAQRFCFEAMEALPDYRKSVRCVKRLAETNMLRGNYDVARKYLELLRHTTMYRRWAERTLQLVDNPELIDSHNVYGNLRRMMLDDDFLYSETEIDKILGQLFVHDNANRVALQYLLMYPLMQRDLDRFMQYLEVVQQRVPYNSRVAQQAIAFAYMKAGVEMPQGVVDPTVQQALRDFATISTRYGKSSEQMRRFRDTLWFYLINETAAPTP